jgi:hypothetical protein
MQIIIKENCFNAKLTNVKILNNIMTKTLHMESYLTMRVRKCHHNEYHMFGSNLFVTTFNLIHKDLPLYISLYSNNPFALGNQNLTCWHIYQNPSFVIQQRHIHLALLPPILFFVGQWHALIKMFCLLSMSSISMGLQKMVHLQRNNLQACGVNL